MPTDTIAVMMPKSMTFKAGPSAPYSPVTEETTAQTYVARSVAPSEPLDFTVSGTGQMPRDTEAAATTGSVLRERLAQAGRRREQQRAIPDQVAGLGFRLIRRGPTILGRSTSGGFWVGWAW